MVFILAASIRFIDSKDRHLYPPFVLQITTFNYCVPISILYKRIARHGPHQDMPLVDPTILRVVLHWAGRLLPLSILLLAALNLVLELVLVLRVLFLYGMKVRLHIVQPVHPKGRLTILHSGLLGRSS
jgi:hypothetical protein